MTSPTCGVFSSAAALEKTPQVGEVISLRQQQRRLPGGERISGAQPLKQSLLRLDTGGGGPQVAQLELELPPAPVFVNLRGEHHVHPVPGRDAGPAAGPVERLARCAVRSTSAHRSYGRTMVCFQVLGERGLIQVEHRQQRVRVTLTTPAEKVDLEQSELMKKLRSFLEP